MKQDKISLKPKAKGRENFCQILWSFITEFTCKWAYETRAFVFDKPFQSICNV